MASKSIFRVGARVVTTLLPVGAVAQNLKGKGETPPLVTFC